MGWEKPSIMRRSSTTRVRKMTRKRVRSPRQVEESTRANVPSSRSLDRGCDSNTANHGKGLRVRVKVGLREMLIQHTERRDPTTLCSLQLGPEAGNPSTKGAKQAVPYRTGREAGYLSVSTDYGVRKKKRQRT